MKYFHDSHERNVITYKLIILILFIFILVFVVTLKHHLVYIKFLNNELTGYSSAKIRLCIGKPSSVVLNNPTNWGVLSGNYNLNATATNPSGDKYVTTVWFFYGENSTHNITYYYICNDTYDNNSEYTCTWDTTTVPDGNCNYIIRAKCDGPCSNMTNQSYYVTINNHDEPPIWDKFKNNLTTNFSQFTSWVELDNVTVGIPNQAALNFSGIKTNFDSADLDSYLNITRYKLSIDTDKLICLRRPVKLIFYNVTYDLPKLYRNGCECLPPMCSFTYRNGTTVTYELLFPSGTYELHEGAVLSLSLFDDSDFGKGFVDNPIRFYANLTNSVGRVINFSDVYCDISFNTTGSYSDWYRMNFNTSTQLYEYDRVFHQLGNFTFKVICNATSHDYDIIMNTSNFTVENRAPILLSYFPNQTWLENTDITGFDLDDYFIDPDGSALYYNHSCVDNITITIDSNNIVTFHPDPGWSGERIVVFYAYDPYDAYNKTNLVYLKVIPTSGSSSSPSSSGGSSTVSIGSNKALISFREVCVPTWNCTDFGPCLSSGIKIRKCWLVNNCTNSTLSLSYKKPREFIYCEYKPTCNDLIKNDGEEGVDCGGPCKPCPFEKPKPSTSPVRLSRELNFLYIILLSLSLLLLTLLLRKNKGIKNKKKLRRLHNLLIFTSRTTSKIQNEYKRLLRGEIDEKRFIDLVRQHYVDYLKYSLGINYNFTAEQLKNELNKNKYSLIDETNRRLLYLALKRLEELQYSRTKLKSHYLVDNLNELILGLTKKLVHIEELKIKRK